MPKQVDKQAYNFRHYCGLGRMASYWHQLDEILKCQPTSVLEIGVGDHLVADYLKNNTTINYTSADVAEDLAPDVICSVTDLKFNNDQFDVVCAFEVLEHLPWQQLPQALHELARVTKGTVLISLPHWGRHFAWQIRLPFFKKLGGQFKPPVWPIKHAFNGQHYWEIGKRGYPLKLVKQIIEQSGLKIIRDYVAFDNPYHHFFILKKI